MSDQPAIPAPSSKSPTPRNPLAVAALVCGIVGLPLAILFSFAGVVLGILAVVLGALAAAKSAKQPTRRRRGRGGIVLGILSITLAVLVIIGLRSFYIPSEAMAPTVQVGDRVLVNTLVYDVGSPQRGDIIVFEDPNAVRPENTSSAEDEQHFIKRVIGIPGDVLEIREGAVFINGEQFDEPSGVQLSTDSFGPVTVEEDMFFVMGDNRPNSADSRSVLGQIPEEMIVGKAFVLIRPSSGFSWLSED
jgi:signal peptidase I